MHSTSAVSASSVADDGAETDAAAGWANPTPPLRPRVLRRTPVLPEKPDDLLQVMGGEPEMRRDTGIVSGRPPFAASIIRMRNA